MKQTKRALSLILVVVLFVSLCAQGGVAASLDNVKQYNYFVGIGDSISRGYGLPSYNNHEMSLHGYEGTFTQILGDAVGCDTDHRYMFNYAGQRTVETLYGIGGDADVYDEYCNKYMSGGRNEIVKRQAEIEENVRKADLITLEVGTNDVFYSSLELSGAMSALDNGASTSELLECAAKCVGFMWEGYNNFVKTFPLIIERLQEITEDCTIIIVGVYNPLENAVLTDEIFVPVGNALSVITGLMNKQYEKWAEEYGVLYANIQNTETPASTGEVTLLDGELKLKTHPTLDGLAYIARQIADVLPIREGISPAEKNKTDIVFDAGSIGKVTSVVVDSQIVKSYTYENNILTVPYTSGSAKTITITAEKDGKVSLYTYQLSFGEDGYEAYRIFNTTNVAKTLSRIVNIISKLFKLITSIF